MASPAVRAYLHQLGRPHAGKHGTVNAGPEMTRIRELSGGLRGGVYSATVSANRPAIDYAARLVPRFGGLSVPLEAGPILWQR